MREPHDYVRARTFHSRAHNRDIVFGGKWGANKLARNIGLFAQKHAQSLYIFSGTLHDDHVRDVRA